VALSASEPTSVCADLSAVAILATAFGVLGDAMRQSFAATFGKASAPHVRGILPAACRALVSAHGGCGDRPMHRKTANWFNRRSTMSKSRSLGAAIAFAVLSAAALYAAPANAAVVYCKSAGVPQGCVVRTQPVVVAPVVRPVAPAATAVRVTRVGYVGAPVSVRHVGYTRVTPYGVRHVGYTRVRR
jgi:hypothetical protein